MLSQHTQFASVVLAGLMSAGALSAQINTGFEAANGYTDGATAVGVNDSGIPGSAAWTNLFGGPTLFASSANPRSGDLALRIERTAATTGGAASGTINLADAGVSFTTAPIELSFSLAFSTYSTGTGHQFQLYLGEAAANPSGGKYWASLALDNGNLILYTSSVTGNSNSPVYLGDPFSYSASGSYIDFKITFDPVAKTYLRFTVSGADKNTDFTASVAGTTLPWMWGSNGSSANPQTHLSFIIGGNDLVTVDIDNLRLSNIPEPASFSMLVGAAIAGFAFVRRGVRR